MKIHAKIFFLYKFWKSFVYLVEKKGSGDSTSGAPRDLNFFLVVLVPKWNGISLGANSYQIFLHLGPPYCASITGKQKINTLLQSFFFKTMPNSLYIFEYIFLKRINLSRSGLKKHLELRNTASETIFA